ncbi:hypothetical protein FHS74_001898 [Nitrospirillum iridis]|uniref:Uncharacterized protein n=1 Tax=Nitrospirillum iridis TaxID=765888 RepID=A0A7X0EC80_9PROT|nr:hypothetical protein [Nitrospirillum iridis]
MVSRGRRPRDTANRTRVHPLSIAVPFAITRKVLIPALSQRAASTSRDTQIGGRHIFFEFPKQRGSNPKIALLYHRPPQRR